MCETDLDCNDHGECLSPGYNCNCDVGWFGSSCNECLLDFDDSGFVIYRFITIGIFTFLGLSSLKRLHNNIKNTKEMASSKRILNTLKNFRNPINLSMIIISLISLTKILWISIDPFVFKNYLHRSLERFLAELIYSLLYALYGMVLIVWYIMYDELSYNINKKRRSCVYKYFKPFMGFRFVSTYVLQICASILKGLRLGKRAQTLIMYSYFFGLILFFIFIIEFGIYGRQVYKLFKDLEEISEKNFYEKKNEIEKVAERLNLEAIILQEEKNKEKESEIDSKGKSSIYIPNSLSPLKEITLSRDKSKSIDSPNTKNQNKFFSQTRESIIKQNLRETIRKSIRIPNKVINVVKFSNIEKSRELPKLSFFKSSNNLEKLEEDKDKLKKKCVKFEKIQVSSTEANDNNTENIEKNNSFIIEDPSKILSWGVDSKERNFLNEKENHKFKQFFDDGTNDTFIEKFLRQNYSDKKEGMTFSQFEDLQNHEILENRNILKENDYQFHRKKQIISSDKKVFKKILFVTISGIIFEVMFAILSVYILSTNILENIARAIYLFLVTSILEFISCFLIYKLFSNIQSKEMENLRWITKIGNAKFNKVFIFNCPQYLLKYNEFSKIFENRLNFLSSNAPHQKPSSKFNPKSLYWKKFTKTLSGKKDHKNRTIITTLPNV